jgi:hypothetical protein
MFAPRNSFVSNSLHYSAAALILQVEDRSSLSLSGHSNAKNISHRTSGVLFDTVPVEFAGRLSVRKIAQTGTRKRYLVVQTLGFNVSLQGSGRFCFARADD